MEIASTFALPLAPDEAYALLLDLDRVAPCLPGATLGPTTGDGARELNLVMRLGPLRFVYDGTISVSEQDDAQRRAVLVGAAREKRGQGTAKATISMRVAAGDAGASTVESTAQVELTGRAAQTGRGIVEDVSRQMVDQMAACLSARYGTAGGGDDASASEPAPVQELRPARLLARVLWQRVRRLFGRPAAR